MRYPEGTNGESTCHFSQGSKKNYLFFWPVTMCVCVCVCLFPVNNIHVPGDLQHRTTQHPPRDAEIGRSSWDWQLEKEGSLGVTVGKAEWKMGEGTVQREDKILEVWKIEWPDERAIEITVITHFKAECIHIISNLYSTVNVLKKRAIVPWIILDPLRITES